ncbi:hypothetical protein MYXA107069_23265 [Myxococcus xanthus]|nr:hypothetical protein MyxoNM_11620 [Myxococcus xanthus]SDY28277.1 hypothetical protein SAMN05444383_13110 [Myxococcus xanthus]
MARSRRGHDVVLDGMPRGLVAGKFSIGDKVLLMVGQEGLDSLSLLTATCLP